MLNSEFIGFLGVGRVLSAVGLLLAGGGGLRFDASVPKQYFRLDNEKAILREVVDRFASCERLEKIVVVIRNEDRDLCAEALRGLEGLVTTLIALPDRQSSVLDALENLVASRPQFVVVHDAVRPFVSEQLICRVLDQLECSDADAVVPVVESTDSLVSMAEGLPVYLLKKAVYKVQTPQGLRFGQALVNYRLCDNQVRRFEDEGSLMGFCKSKVVTVEGEPQNIKITFSSDLNKHLVDNRALS